MRSTPRLPPSSPGVPYQGLYHSATPLSSQGDALGQHAWSVSQQLATNHNWSSARTSGALRIFSPGVNWARQLLALMRRQQVTATMVQAVIAKDAKNRKFSTVHVLLLKLLNIGCAHSRLLDSALN